MAEDLPSESLHEYCYQLGLKVRDINGIKNNMEVTCSSVRHEETGEDPGHSASDTSPKDVPKNNYDCKNCGKSFTSSRQVSKHKCSSKESPESPPKLKVNTRGKSKRILARNEAAKEDKEPTVVDEDTQTVVHLTDHTYNRDDLVGEENKETSEENPSEMAKKQQAKCELCCMFPESDSVIKETPNVHCEKCQELAADLKKDSTSVSTSADDKTSSETNPPAEKKRKYVFKKPEDFCPHCNKGFHSEKRLAKHAKVCGKNLVCEFCGKDFNDCGQHAYSKYEQHYYTHVDEKPFQCSVCSKGFVRKSDLDKHNVIHTTEYEPQTCMQCGAVFATSKLLNKHMKKHNRPSWDCPKCNKRFVRHVIFEKHVVSCQKQVSCEVCGKIFQCLSKNVKSRYQEHMFIHTGEKPYKCHFCERAFRDRSTRKKHERSHTGEKPYPCTLCDRAFAQLRLLRNHVRTHTGEKPFACNLCDLRFAKQCNLKYHIRVHTKEKPYTCQVCQKSFTQSGTYHKHMRRHQSKTTSSNHPLTMPSKNNTSAGQSESSNFEAAPELPTEPENEQVIQEIPIASDEITIIVSEGNVNDDGTTTLTTIDVEQISNMLASCS